jgi:20S proteasome subunit alpha 2
MGESGHSFSLTTFAPTGKLLQTRYALNCVAEGLPSLGIKAKNGVVLAAEKKMASLLIEDTSVQNVKNLSDSVGIVSAGLPPDFRALLEKGRKEAQIYFTTNGEMIPTSQIVRKMAAVMQESTQQGGVRPFGVSLLMAGYDDSGPQLFQVDPSGSHFGRMASAIGKSHVNAESFLEKRFAEDVELEDAIHIAILTLKEGFKEAIMAEAATPMAPPVGHPAAQRAGGGADDQVDQYLLRGGGVGATMVNNEFVDDVAKALKKARAESVDEFIQNVEIGVVGEDRKFRVLTPAEVQSYLSKVE